MPWTLLILGAILALALGLLIRSCNQDKRLVLAWFDEFDGPAGSAPDQTKWVYDIGGHGWGNNELQTYTDRRLNSYIDGNSCLVIRALRETYTGPDGIEREYTSARLLTKGKFAQRYGRFSMRIKIPYGQGIWPAGWMLGANIDEVGWPRCGEIDNMENIGREPSTNHGSLHGPGYCGGDSLTGIVTLPNGERLSDDFHVYTVDWDEDKVVFYIDDQHYLTRSRTDAQGKEWVFDHPFFLLLNIAVGGNWPGSPDETTVFPQAMLVDWVRAYKWQS